MTAYDTSLNSRDKTKISQRIAILVHEGKIEDGVTESDVAEMLTAEGLLEDSEGNARKIHHASTRSGLKACGIQCSTSQPINMAGRVDDMEARIEALERFMDSLEIE